MNKYAHWTPATDTTEIRSDLRGPFWETTTVEMHLLDLRPALEPYRRPSLLARAAAHLRASAEAVFWPSVFVGGMLIGLAIALATRGQVVTWTGVESVGGIQ